MLKNKLSCCLATYNEEKNLKHCLNSVKNLADEIIVVDGSSQDQTAEIAREFNAKVFKTSNKTMFHLNKQMAFDKAGGDWILYLDADEEVSKELKKEILSVLNQPKRHLGGEIFRHLRGGLVHRSLGEGGGINGFWIPRKNIIFGKWMKHTGWWPDWQLRLFRRGRAKLACKSVHEQPDIDGETGCLNNPLVHYNYQNISQFIKRLNLYTENDKNVLLKKGEELKWQDFLIKPADEFIKRFLAWHGYKDGVHGLALSLLQAFYQLVVYLKLWEEKGFTKLKIIKMNDQVRKIIKDKQKEYYWWQKEIKIKNAGAINKIALKIFRRVGL